MYYLVYWNWITHGWVIEDPYYEFQIQWLLREWLYQSQIASAKQLPRPIIIKN